MASRILSMFVLLSLSTSTFYGTMLLTVVAAPNPAPVPVPTFEASRLFNGISPGGRHDRESPNFGGVQIADLRQNIQSRSSNSQAATSHNAHVLAVAAASETEKTVTVTKTATKTATSTKTATATATSTKTVTATKTVTTTEMITATVTKTVTLNPNPGPTVNPSPSPAPPVPPPPPPPPPPSPQPPSKPAPIPSAPRFLVYSDQFISGVTGAPPVSEVQGWNVFTLSFLLLEGPADKAEEWTQLTDSQRSTLLSEYHDAGVSIIVSAFGSTDIPTTTGADPIATANKMAAWVLQFSLDGIDVDYEDFGSMDERNGVAENWLIQFTRQLRVSLPVGQYILTHAPVAPWFCQSCFKSGAYRTVDSQVGNLIDWYNVQFYNQGATEYTTCPGLLTNSSSNWPETSLFQIAANGISLDKLVIGKPATAAAAANGFIAPATLSTCVAQAKTKGWSAGVMAWEFPDANAAWIKTVRGTAFPV